jgi:SAM-dependent methyltransferase
MIEYKPIEYWRHKGETFIDEFFRIPEVLLQEKILLWYLKKLKFKSVLELGAGFGRIASVVTSNFDVDRYVAVDISPHQLSHIRSNPQLQIVDPVLSNVHDLPFDSKFDLILSAEILLHVKPDDIFSLLTKLKKLSNNIINIDPDPDPAMHYHPLDYYNFLHDFEKIYKQLGLNVNTIALKSKEINTRQYLFHASVRNINIH